LLAVQSGRLPLGIVDRFDRDKNCWRIRHAHFRIEYSANLDAVLDMAEVVELVRKAR